MPSRQQLRSEDQNGNSSFRYSGGSTAGLGLRWGLQLPKIRAKHAYNGRWELGRHPLTSTLIAPAVGSPFPRPAPPRPAPPPLPRTPHLPAWPRTTPACRNPTTSQPHNRAQPCAASQPYNCAQPYNLYATAQPRNHVAPSRPPHRSRLPGIYTGSEPRSRRAVMLGRVTSASKPGAAAVGAPSLRAGRRQGVCVRAVRHWVVQTRRGGSLSPHDLKVFSTIMHDFSL
jgi:hypothetical protein